MLPGYKDPYHGRPLTKGELGCFLSHYNIWKEVRHSDRPRTLGSICTWKITFTTEKHSNSVCVRRGSLVEIMRLFDLCFNISVFGLFSFFKTSLTALFFMTK